MTNIAVIQTGGKQYVVSKDDVISVETMPGAEKVGDKITFESVLLTDNGKESTVGAPEVKGAKIAGEVVEVGHAPKVTVLRYKAKSRYQKKKGHRQPYVKVKITDL